LDYPGTSDIYSVLFVSSSFVQKTEAENRGQMTEDGRKTSDEIQILVPWCLGGKKEKSVTKRNRNPHLRILLVKDAVIRSFKIFELYAGAWTGL
jgi:hypothetical protein